MNSRDLTWLIWRTWTWEILWTNGKWINFKLHWSNRAWDRVVIGSSMNGYDSDTLLMPHKCWFFTMEWRGWNLATSTTMALNGAFHYTNFTLSELHYNYSYILDWDNGLILMGLYYYPGNICLSGCLSKPADHHYNIKRKTQRQRSQDTAHQLSSGWSNLSGDPSCLYDKAD